MAGLRLVLESLEPQVIYKSTIIIRSLSSPSSPPLSAAAAAGFLDRCSLCRRKLLPGKDIYMYKGDEAFCTVECRCRRMVMDEEEKKISSSLSQGKKILN
ncbi:hypothetical protein NMG60_11031589 [Bertholletia excelsa]